MRLFLVVVALYILAVAAVISPEDRCPERSPWELTATQSIH